MNLSIDSDDLRPLVATIVAEVLAAIQAPTVGTCNQLAYPESEAATLLGCRPHVLRDARLRGEITHTKVGGRIAYEKAELINYLARMRGAK